MMSVCHFDSLPDEIVELIFSNVPLMNLFQTCSLVCSRWRNIVGGSKFIPWKKSYYRYKLLPNEDPDEDPFKDSNEEDDDDKAKPPKKKRRLEENDEEANSFFWKHLEFFR